MRIEIDPSGPRESRWYEYVLRFAFGGIVTALTGVIAKHFGPEIGGLFLAFPAILPATATLIEEHQSEEEESAGDHKSRLARRVAGVDAAGAAMGCAGLAVFAAIVWQELPHSALWSVLIVATVAWLCVSVGVWLFREKVWRALRRKIHTSHQDDAVMDSSQPSAHRRTR